MTAFEATQEHRAEGHTSPIEWQKHHCRAKGPDASRRRRTSRQLRTLPLVDEALTAGLISVEHVEVLARAQTLLGEEIFAQLEAPLVEAAVDMRFSDFLRTVDYAVTRARCRGMRRSGPHASSRTATPARLAPSAGAGKVDAGMDPVGFTIWQAELDRLVKHLLEVDRAEARDRLGRDPLASELARTARQRRVDAMVLMAERSAAFGDRALGPSSFCVTVHGDAVLVACIIAALRQALADEGYDLDQALDDIELGADSLHELDDGTVITINTIVLALLTGTVSGILYDPDGDIIRLGTEQRLFNRAQARALRAKYRRCAHPYGCDRTHPFLQSDHIVEHTDGGPTDLTNGQGLDGGHNIWKTNHKHDPPPDNPDRGQRRLPPDIGPPPPTR